MHELITDPPESAGDGHDAVENPAAEAFDRTGPGPLTESPALRRAINELEHTDLGFEHSRRQIRPIAHRTLSAALRDRQAIREALRTADDDYQAREHAANVARGPEPGDWWLFMVNAMVDHLLGQDDASLAAILGGADREVGAGSRALRDIAAERESHAERGFNVAHDDMHNVHDLTQLAQRYVNLSGSGRYPDAEPGYISRTALVKAGSLLVAAIDRLDRAEADRV